MKLPYKMRVKKRPLLAQYIELLRACWYFADHKRSRMYIFYALFVVANVLFMFQPWVIGQLINTLQIGGDGLMRNAALWLCVYVGLSFAFWAFHGPGRVLERRLAFRVKRAYTLYCYDIVTKLPLRWHRDHHTGNTINRVNKTVNGLNAFCESQYAYAENVIRVITIFAILAMVNIYVAVGVFVFSVLILLLLSGYDKIMLKNTHEMNEREHLFSSTLLDFLGNIDNVILFTLKRHSVDKISSAVTHMYPPLKKLITVNELKWFSLMGLMSVGHFGVLLGYIGYHLYYELPLMLGTVVAIFQYMLKLDWVLVSVAFLYQRLIREGSDFGAIEDIFDDYERVGSEEEGSDHLSLKQGRIAFKNIYFTHERGAEVFKGMNLDIPAGQKLGVIGHSGAGKTTLVQLLLRFYDTEGQGILIDGQNISEVSTDSLRQNISIIPQDTTLFETTLLENIRYGRLDATDEEVYKAAEQAYCDEFIRHMPDGYETHVGERGVKLSGGQRQRVSIARAVLKNAPILVLDEATSALDTESEQYIQDSLKEVMKGKTVIAIAHRLSTLKHLDRIVVFENGKIVEEGAHADLMKLGGVYARLWQKQSGNLV